MGRYGVAFESPTSIYSLGSGVEVTNLRVFSNGSTGIYAVGSTRVTDNTAHNNGGWGLFLSADSGYRDNVITNNAGGSVSGGVNAGGNVCDGSLTCP